MQRTPRWTRVQLGAVRQFDWDGSFLLREHWSRTKKCQSFKPLQNCQWIQHVNCCTHDWCYWENGLVYQSISERSERINRRHSRRQGHGTWPRSELCERRGRHGRPYFFIGYFSINWFPQNGYDTSLWTGLLSKIQIRQIIKMVIFFTQNGGALHQNGID